LLLAQPASTTTAQLSPFLCSLSLFESHITRLPGIPVLANNTKGRTHNARLRSLDKRLDLTLNDQEQVVGSSVPAAFHIAGQLEEQVAGLLGDQVADKLQSSNSPDEHEPSEGRQGTPMRPQRAGDKLPEASVSEKRTKVVGRPARRARKGRQQILGISSYK
jgi:hypothetical protein